MRSIITFLMLALVGTTSQAAVERFPLDNPAACVMAYTQLYVDGAKNGWERKSSDGKDVFIKDGYVGYFASYAVDGSNCVLQSETLAEFQERITPRPVPRNPSREEPEVSFWDTGWGTVAKVAITIVVAKALWKVSAPLSTGCANTWDIAKDGSKCGLRAASVRPGGK
jgi:hypothetical protein